MSVLVQAEKKRRRRGNEVAPHQVAECVQAIMSRY